VSWKRNQKYLPRPRHLYALFFNGGCCYVGQTVDLLNREKQHRGSRGGWQGRPFQFVPLGQMVGTQADAEVHEYAWRYKAHLKGWRIYAKPPGMLIRDPPTAHHVAHEEPGPWTCLASNPPSATQTRGSDQKAALGFLQVAVALSDVAHRSPMAPAIGQCLRALGRRGLGRKFSHRIRTKPRSIQALLAHLPLLLQEERKR